MSVDRRLRIAAIAALIVVLIAGAVAAALLLTSPPGEPGSAPSTSPSTPSTPASPDASPSTEPSPSASVDPDFGEPVADEAPKDGEAVFDDGVAARIERIESITATGSVAGEVSGPAVQVDLALENRSAEAISLDAVTVNAYYGDDRRPASPISQTSSPPFSGSLAAGAVAHGQYVFTVPAELHESVVITISVTPGSPVVVFE
jgi:hypothetical protein